MLALGAWRLARAQVLTRQPQAIEALGTATVLCVDKTGTLTLNRMRWSRCTTARTASSACATAMPCLRACRPWCTPRRWPASKRGIEPMDQAILRLAPARDLAGRAPCCRATAWRPASVRAPRVERGRRRACARRDQGRARSRAGALRGCAATPAGARAAGAGLGAAWLGASSPVARQRGTGAAAASDSGCEALGLVAFEDPLRDDVPAAIAQCRHAGCAGRDDHRRCAGDGPGDRARARGWWRTRCTACGARARIRMSHRRRMWTETRCAATTRRSDTTPCRVGTCSYSAPWTPAHCKKSATSFSLVVLRASLSAVRLRWRRILRTVAYTATRAGAQSHARTSLLAPSSHPCSLALLSPFFAPNPTT
jgi:hypothetical protein